MTAPLIAVAIASDGSLSDHAGRALHWAVYVADHGTPERVWDIQLSETGCLHEWHVRGDGERHPLHRIDVAIARSGGEGVTRRLAARGTKLITTRETDPDTAVNHYLRGMLAPGNGHDPAVCLDPANHLSS